MKRSVMRQLRLMICMGVAIIGMRTASTVAFAAGADTLSARQGVIVRDAVAGAVADEAQSVISFMHGDQTKIQGPATNVQHGPAYQFDLPLRQDNVIRFVEQCTGRTVVNPLPFRLLGEFEFNAQWHYSKAGVFKRAVTVETVNGRRILRVMLYQTGLRQETSWEKLKRNAEKYKDDNAYLEKVGQRREDDTRTRGGFGLELVGKVLAATDGRVTYEQMPGDVIRTELCIVLDPFLAREQGVSVGRTGGVPIDSQDQRIRDLRNWLVRKTHGDPTQMILCDESIEVSTFDRDMHLAVLNTIFAMGPQRNGVLYHGFVDPFAGIMPVDANDERNLKVTLRNGAVAGKALVDRVMTMLGELYYGSAAQKAMFRQVAAYARTNDPQVLDETTFAYLVKQHFINFYMREMLTPARHIILAAVDGLGDDLSLQSPVYRAIAVPGKDPWLRPAVSSLQSDIAALASA